MPDRITKVTTRHGDKGHTSLADGKRYAKFDPEIELVGILDEANASLGLAATILAEPYRTDVVELQSRLFDIGAAVATGTPQQGWDTQTENLEQKSSNLNSTLEPLREFVLPGSNEVSARLHVARTVVRRAERLFWKAANDALRESSIGTFLNRASDYLFVLARSQSDVEVLWQPLDRPVA